MYYYYLCKSKITLMIYIVLTLHLNFHDLFCRFYLTNQLLRKVFENKENFSIIEIQERNLPHTILNKTLLRSIA